MLVLETPKGTRISRHLGCVLCRYCPEGEATYADLWCRSGGSLGAVPVDRVHRAQPHSRRHRGMRRVVRRLDAACRARLNAFRRYVAPDLSLRHVRRHAEAGCHRRPVGWSSGLANLGTPSAQRRPLVLRRYPGLCQERGGCVGLSRGQVVFVEGMVEETLPATRPEQVSLLRLDTDLYRSTYHELVHLYPLLSAGGILIIDDYGAFRGAQSRDRPVHRGRTGCRCFCRASTGRCGSPSSRLYQDSASPRAGWTASRTSPPAAGSSPAPCPAPAPAIGSA